jgi:uncharacterized UPF0160 family protein
MKLLKKLEQQQSHIIKEWIECVNKTYPAETTRFLGRVKDAFDNPIGHANYQSLEGVVKSLSKGWDIEELKKTLDSIIRVRAVQSFTSSEAVAFVYDLKKIVFKQLKDEQKNSQFWEEWLAFEAKIDELALIAFDKYMECREKIYQIKASEEKNRTFRAFERAGLVREIPQELEPGPHNSSF